MQLYQTPNGAFLRVMTDHVSYYGVAADVDVELRKYARQIGTEMARDILAARKTQQRLPLNNPIRPPNPVTLPPPTASTNSPEVPKGTVLHLKVKNALYLSDVQQGRAMETELVEIRAYYRILSFALRQQYPLQNCHGDKRWESNGLIHR